MAVLNHRWQVVPNILSCGRLALVPAVVWRIMQDDPASAFFLCALAGITDGLDGWIARRCNTSSALGAVLDALADKALIVAVYAALAAKAWLPLWLVVLVVLRDLAIVSGGVLSYWRRWFAPVRPLAISRINTVIQIALAAWLLASHGFALHDDMFQDGAMTVLLMSAVTCTTTMSAVAYGRRWWQEWRQQERI